MKLRLTSAIQIAHDAKDGTFSIEESRYLNKEADKLQHNHIRMGVTKFARSDASNDYHCEDSMYHHAINCGSKKGCVNIRTHPSPTRK
eukprot:4946012-Amphidinium_carterae.1